MSLFNKDKNVRKLHIVHTTHDEARQRGRPAVGGSISKKVKDILSPRTPHFQEPPSGGLTSPQPSQRHPAVQGNQAAQYQPNHNPTGDRRQEMEPRQPYIGRATTGPTSRKGKKDDSAKGGFSLKRTLSAGLEGISAAGAEARANFKAGSELLVWPRREPQEKGKTKTKTRFSAPFENITRPRFSLHRNKNKHTGSSSGESFYCRGENPEVGANAEVAALPKDRQGGNNSGRRQNPAPQGNLTDLRTQPALATCRLCKKTGGRVVSGLCRACQKSPVIYNGGGGEFLSDYLQPEEKSSAPPPPRSPPSSNYSQSPPGSDESPKKRPQNVATKPTQAPRVEGKKVPAATGGPLPRSACMKPLPPLPPPTPKPKAKLTSSSVRIQHPEIHHPRPERHISHSALVVEAEIEGDDVEDWRQWQTPSQRREFERQEAEQACWNSYFDNVDDSKKGYEGKGKGRAP